MEYSTIIKQAFESTKRNKIMWLLGIFVASGSGGGWNFRLPTSFDSEDFGSAGEGFRVFDWDVWFTEYWWLVLLIGVLILALIIVQVILHNIAVGGMFYGAQQTAGNVSVKFRQLFGVGTKYFPKMFGLHFLVKATFVMALLLISIPLIALAFTIIGLVVVIPVAIVLFLALIPIGAVVHILFMFARQYIVLRQQSIMDSLKSSWQLFKNHLGDSVVMYLLSLLIGLGVGLATLIIVLLIALPFAILGFILYNAVSWPGVIGVAVLGVLVLMIVLFIVKGMYQAFTFHLWHRTFAEMQPAQ